MRMFDRRAQSRHSYEEVRRRVVCASVCTAGYSRYHASPTLNRPRRCRRRHHRCYQRVFPRTLPHSRSRRFHTAIAPRSRRPKAPCLLLDQSPAGKTQDEYRAQRRYYAVRFLHVKYENGTQVARSAAVRVCSSCRTGHHAARAPTLVVQYPCRTCHFTTLHAKPLFMPSIFTPDVIVESTPQSFSHTFL